MRAAYEALDVTTREQIAGFAAYHSLYHSQSAIGEGDDTTAHGLAVLHAGDRTRPAQASAGYRQTTTPPLRPLVKNHPVTGKPALYIGRHAYGIPDRDPEESRRLLADLVVFACQPPRVHTHRWQPGDVVIWDNRCVLHRARPWRLDEPPIMHHTRVDGDPATEGALPDA